MFNHNKTYTSTNNHKLFSKIKDSPCKYKQNLGKSYSQLHNKPSVCVCVCDISRKGQRKSKDRTLMTIVDSISKLEKRV